MKSNHLPKNTTIPLPLPFEDDVERAEIFWQTVNCDHFMENYRADSVKTNPKERVPDTSPTTSSSPNRPSRSTATKPKVATTRVHSSLPGKGPWFRMDGVWYTKDETGEIVPMK